jgi:polar amino acid transport system substrate-binding protein
MRQVKHYFSAWPVLLLAVSVFAVPVTAADLAPTGTLRAAFLGANPVQGHVDAKTGAITGPVADLVQELARRLKVPYQIIPAPNAAAVIGHLKDHSADIGFLAYDATRAEQVDFSGSYALMYNTYVVRADSAIQKAADVDRPGIRVASVKGQTQQLFLSENLKNAKVIVMDTMPPLDELEKMLLNGEIEAFGANRQRMEEAAATHPKLRALPDNFSVVEQAIVIEKGDPARMEILNRFLDDVRASGFVKASLDRAHISGVGVATERGR